MSSVPSNINVGVGNLPSSMYHAFLATSSTDTKQTDPTRDGDHGEALLQQVLSALAAQKDLGRFKKGKLDAIPSWLWKTLTDDDHETQLQVPQSEKPEYEWYMGIRLIHNLLPTMSPLDVHAVANQTIVFTEGSLTHGSLCLLLCVYALRQCSITPNTRWKRWQSLVAETIRLYQNYGLDLVPFAVPLWVDHLVPACSYVIRQLPSNESYQVAFLASLVGTTSTMVVRECRRPEKEGDVTYSVLSHVMQLLQLTRQIVQHDDGHGYSDTWVWLHPWRVYSEQRYHPHSSAEEDKNVEVEFLQRKQDIAWWTERAYRHERVAGMDTSWDAFGIALMALVAFDDRPLVLAPSHVWMTWFPHVLQLFESTSDLSSLQHLPLSLLDNLLRVIPPHSLPAVHTKSTTPDSPFETFQQLSNRILVQPRKEGSEDPSPHKHHQHRRTAGLELDSQKNSERIVGLMKTLLSRYEPVNQVKIIRKLVHDCPHPGLQAKFMDLSRAVLFEPSAADAFWSYINTFVKEMTSHIDRNPIDDKMGDDDESACPQRENEVPKCIVKDEGGPYFINVDDLVQKVEIYVGAVTMIQLWCLVKSKLPQKISHQSLIEFHDVLKGMLDRWMTDSMSMPPDDYYRLYLLEGALQQVVQILDEARKGEKYLDEAFIPSDDLSAHSTQSSDLGIGNSQNETEERLEKVLSEGQPRPQQRRKNQAIVGDASLFS